LNFTTSKSVAISAPRSKSFTVSRHPIKSSSIHRTLLPLALSFVSPPKVRPGHQHVSHVWRLEGGSVLLLFRDEKAAQHRHVVLNGGAIDRRRVDRVDQLLRLARQRNDIVSDNANADVVKIGVGEHGDV